MNSDLLTRASFGLVGVLAVTGFVWYSLRDDSRDGARQDEATSEQSDEASRAIAQLRRDVDSLSRTQKVRHAPVQAAPAIEESAASAAGDDQQNDEFDDVEVPIEERRELAFARADAYEEQLLAAVHTGRPGDPDHAREIRSAVSEPFADLGAALTDVDCSDELCKTTIEYPESSDPAPLEQVIGKSICVGACWVRRPRDRNQWKVFSVRRGVSFPEMGPLPTD